ncbi:MAG: TIR domain-containing protein [Bryobacterales bacterium]|nr:TIR domain-containing protein [Bryobacterales bacterium]
MAETKVFISYARKDAAGVAQELCGRLKEAGVEAWLDTADIGGGRSWTDEIEGAIDGCDVGVALLSRGSYLSDICRAEQLRLLRKGKRVVPVVVTAGADVPLHLETKNYRDLTGKKPLDREWAALLADVGSPTEGVRLRKEFGETYVTAPPFPPNYLARPEVLERLRNALVTDSGGPSIAVTALEGMGGIGKTVLAQALCHDEVVQQAFPDGIIWITAGKEGATDAVSRFREVGKGLNDDLTGYDTELGCINRYRSVLRRKAALIVVDDVWNARDIEPFRAESERSRLLFTTRDGTIAGAVGATVLTAKLLSAEQSRQLLGEWTKLAVNGLPAEAGEILQEAGGLPLAVAMLGAMLRGKPRSYWPLVLKMLRSADLQRIQAQFPHYPHTNLLRAIQVSIDALDERARRRYLALAVLLEDMVAQPAVQQVLWDADEFECLETAEQFVSLSLAQRDEASGGIRLHDLQLDYIRAQYADREALGLIHGAVRLSAHVLAHDPEQFVSQMVARLLAHNEVPGVRTFVESIGNAARKPWLRALWPALHPPGTGLVRTLAGHADPVNGVALSGDGRVAISASIDGTLKVWEVARGREVRTLAGHTGWVNGVALSGDGRVAVSASADRTLKVWDVESGREVRTLAGHAGPVRGVALSRNGRVAVSASDDWMLKVWDLASGREVRTLAGHAESVNGVALSADGWVVISASVDGTLKVWDLASGREVRTLVGHTQGVSGVALSADGRVAISASIDGTLKVWEVASGRELRTLAGHAAWVRDVALSGDGRVAVSASDDKTLKVWEVASGREVRTLAGHAAWVRDVALSEDGQVAVSASWDQTLKVWEVASGREVRTPAGHADRVRGATLSGNGRVAISASDDSLLKVWEVESGREVRTLTGHTQGVNGVALSADGRVAVSASWDQTLKVWEVESGRELRTLWDAREASGVALSGDGRVAVSASRNRTLKVWEVASGQEVRMLVGHSGPVSGVALSRDGRVAVSASSDMTLKVWEVASGQEVRTLVGHSGPVNGVALSGDGRVAVSASEDGTLKVWNVTSGRELRTLAGHSREVWGVALSADVRVAVSASSDKTLKVREVASGREVASFRADAGVLCCAIGSDGMVIAGDTEGHVHLLRLERAEG